MNHPVCLAALKLCDFRSQKGRGCFAPGPEPLINLARVFLSWFGGFFKLHEAAIS